MSFISLVMFCLVWFCFGWVCSSIRQKFVENSIDVHNTSQPNIKCSVFKTTKIEIVKMDGQLYVYEADGGQFLVQGVSLDDLTIKLIEMYPMTNFTISQDNFSNLLGDK